MPEETTPKTSQQSAKRSPVSKQSGAKIRLEHLAVKNFKALDDFEIDFPAPRMSKDQDIFVLGSRNGLGKTSVLEACYVLFLALSAEDELDANIARRYGISFDVYDLIIHAGAEKALIDGNFTIDDKAIKISLNIMKGKIITEGDKSAFRRLMRVSKSGQYYTSENAARFFTALAGLNSDPLLLPPFMYFHSYRKVQEGSLELGMMVENERLYPRNRYRIDREMPISIFKLEILRSLMSQGGLFENLDNRDAESVLSKLNELMETFAGGRIEKLRPLPDNTIEFRVTPINNNGPSFTFDGLSSGQKEIISTLFLIWHYTRQQPGIILIDEPELHLNAEWHRKFIQYLYQLASNNQYIMATHSEDVFGAVDKDRRILLEDSEEWSK